jgi:hypothetical protein
MGPLFLHTTTIGDLSMIAIYTEGKAEPVLVVRVSCTKKGLQFVDENGKVVSLEPRTIKSVKKHEEISIV